MDSYTINVGIRENIMGIFSIISIVAVWKIFSDHGEKGWKALIPFYSSYIFGKITGEPQKGKKAAILEAIATFFAFVFIFLALYFYTNAVMQSGGPDFIINGNLSDVPMNIDLSSSIDGTTALMIFGTMILMLVFIVWAWIVNLKIRYRYTVDHGNQTWMILLWIFLPVIPNVYYAFQRNIDSAFGVRNDDM